MQFIFVIGVSYIILFINFMLAEKKNPKIILSFNNNSYLYWKLTVLEIIDHQNSEYRGQEEWNYYMKCIINNKMKKCTNK